MLSKTPARRVMQLFMVAVAVLHATAIALYYGLNIPRAAPSTQRMFAWAWIVLTAALVIAGLQRLKWARRRR
jgi:uncharacterized membrane protein